MLIVMMLTALQAVAPQPVQAGNTRPDLEWMSGYWLSCEGGREVAEVWLTPRLGLMAGVNVTVRDGRVGWEMSRIAALDAAPDAPFAYFAEPEGQGVTVFPVVDSGDDRVVFEQARGDDFPKRIVYERQDDALIARIEGVIGGEERTVRWRFRRAELNSRCPA